MPDNGATCAKCRVAAAAEFIESYAESLLETGQASSWPWALAKATADCDGEDIADTLAGATCTDLHPENP